MSTLISNSVPSWRELLTQLESCLTAHDKRLAIIGTLDQCILNTGVSPNVVAELALAGLCDQLPIEAAYLLFHFNGHFQTAVSHPKAAGELRFVLDHSSAEQDVPLDLRQLTPLPSGIDDDGHWRSVSITLYDQTVAALVVKANTAIDVSNSVSDPFFARVVDQLRIAYLTHRDRRRRALAERVQNAFLATQLNLSLCLDWIVSEVQAILGLEINATIQILTRSGNYLNIRRSTAVEAEGARVLMLDSATGRRILAGGTPQPFDPRLDPFYKAMSASVGVMKSELVIPLVADATIFGAINVEASKENAFDALDCERLLDLAVAVGPSLNGLIVRTEMAIRDRHIMFHAIDTMCTRLAVLYNHKLSSPVHACRTAVHLLMTESERLTESQQRILLENVGGSLNRLVSCRA